MAYLDWSGGLFFLFKQNNEHFSLQIFLQYQPNRFKKKRPEHCRSTKLSTEFYLLTLPEPFAASKTCSFKLPHNFRLMPDIKLPKTLGSLFQLEMASRGQGPEPEGA